MSCIVEYSHPAIFGRKHCHSRKYGNIDLSPSVMAAKGTETTHVVISTIHTTLRFQGIDAFPHIIFQHETGQLVAYIIN